jgi:hypothetical protein
MLGNIDAKPSAENESLFQAGLKSREAGRVDEAFTTFCDVVEWRVRYLGLEAFATLVAMSQLGWAMLASGRSKEARLLHYLVLVKRLHTYGATHAYTQRSAGILAATLNAFSPSADALSAALLTWSNGIVPENPQALLIADGTESAPPGSVAPRGIDELEARLKAFPATVAAIRQAFAGPSLVTLTPLPSLSALDLERVKAGAVFHSSTGCYRCNGTGKEWRSAIHGPRYRTCIECGGTGKPGGRSKGDR